MNPQLHSSPVLYFDGVCNLCNRFVQFVIRRDRKKIFFFGPLQSDAGTKAMQQVKLPSDKPGSVILFSNGKYYTRSAAALHTFQLLGGGWQLLFVFILIPPFIRDAVYNLIARNRYKWFGRQASCMLPTAETANRFVN